MATNSRYLTLNYAQTILERSVKEKTGKIRYYGTTIDNPTRDAIIDLVKTRWNIEVYHRELKQTSGLERCQSRTSRVLEKDKRKKEKGLHRQPHPTHTHLIWVLLEFDRIDILLNFFLLSFVETQQENH